MNSERNASGADPSSWGALATAVDEPENSGATPSDGSENASRNSLCFYGDERVSRRAQQWAHDPSTFFRDVPQGCIACQLYKRIQALFSEKRKPCRPKGSKQPEEATLINAIELRIYLAQFYLLRSGFKAAFHDFTRDPLMSFLGEHELAEHGYSLAGLGKVANKGMCYHALATMTGHPGVLLLSTTFKTEELENKKHSSSISETAIKDIKHVTEMQLYDKAVEGVFDVFEKCREDWLMRTKDWQVQGVPAPVQSLVDALRRGDLGQPGKSGCNLGKGLQPVCLPSSATQESAKPLQTSPVAAADAFPFVSPLPVFAQDIHGVACCFDTDTIVFAIDKLGVNRQLRVGALAEGLSAASGATLLNDHGSLADALFNIAVYKAAEYTGERE